MSRAIEETFNQALGRGLRKTTVRWQHHAEAIAVERTGVIDDHPKLRPDLLIHDLQAPPLVIECSFQERDAEKDARDRLGLVAKKGHYPIKTALAVHVPDRFRALSLDAMEEALEAGQEIRFALYQASVSFAVRRWPQSGWISTDVRNLALFLPASALHKEAIERVAEQVASLLKSAAMRLEQRLPPQVLASLIREVFQRSPLTGLRTIMVLWLDAELTASFLRKMRALDTSAAEPAVTGGARPSEHLRVWTEILKRNWRPIFAPAVASLRDASHAHILGTSQALDLIKTAREQLEIAHLGLHINVGAELFPILSEDRKQAAAYYTQPATAELLAGLTIRYDQLSASQWRDAALFTRHRLADLTCGTGTLLRAGYRRVAAFHEQSGGTVESCEELHRYAMEFGLVGTDVSPIAAHLTASSLAAIGTGAPYDQSQIGWVAVGGSEGLTGSLEYFARDSVHDLFDAAGGVSAGTAEVQTASVGVPDHGFDWILMNPPYSRTRGGQSAFDIAGLTDQERQACQKRWGKLVKAQPCSNQAGMAASFLVLARQKVKLGGRIGFVLPLTAALADTWTPTRRMIEQDFEDVIVLAVAAGQAFGKEALSADTHMEEMLLIGSRKKESHGQDRPSNGQLLCVTLHHAPTRMGEAGEIARAILEASTRIKESFLPICAGTDEIGQMCVLPTDGTGSPWSPVGVLRLDLMQAAMDLGRGTLNFGSCTAPMNVEMAPIGDLFAVGPTHHLIGHLSKSTFECGAFEMHPIRRPTDALGRDRALWAANSKTQQTLQVLPTHKGVAPAGVGSEPERQRIRQSRSTVFYGRNMRWTSQALLAASTANAVLGGSAWVSLGHPDTRVRKAFALWTNSILGLLVHWTQGQRTQLGRARTQIGAVKQISCPNLESLPGEKLALAEAEFDRLKDCVMAPACQSHADAIRKQVDRAVLRMLGLDFSEAVATVSTMRILWCHEPSVHGYNKAALRLLDATA